MKILKNNLMIVLFAIVLSNTGFTHTAEKNTSWLDTLEGVIFGDVTIKSLFASKPRPSEAYELTPFSELPLKKIPFTSLPKELQNKIIGYLSMVIDDSDIVASAQAISSLAQVNKELNQKINEPEFTAKLIENFYEKFKGTTYRMPYTFQYQSLTIGKGTKRGIDQNDKSQGYMSVAILLKTEGAVKWLSRYKPFQEWLAERQKEIEESNDYGGSRALDPWT